MRLRTLALLSALAAAAGLAPVMPVSAQTGADGHFMVQAADGGLTEVQLGRLAMQRAADPAVRDFGRRMVTDHGNANAQLQRLAGQEGVALPTEPSVQHRALYDRLARLAGPDFDRSYMRNMVDDHTQDVADFEREAQQGQDPAVRAWAAQTLPTLHGHLRFAQSIESRVAGVPPAPGVAQVPVASPATTIIVTTPGAPLTAWCGGAYSPTLGTNLASCASPR